MKKRSGFTLMELLLVVAVLAIVAAAAAPTFFGGAADAMKEARKARIASAFTQLFSEANMAAAVAQAKGEAVVAGTTPKTPNWPDPDYKTVPHPDGSDNKITLTVGWDADKGVIITATTGGYLPTEGVTSEGVITDLEEFLKGFK